MRKRNLPASAEPSDAESVEAPQRKQQKSRAEETPSKKLTIAEQRQRAKEWAEQNLSASKPPVAPASTSKSAAKSSAKPTATSKLTVEEQRKKAEEWAIENGFLQSATKKRLSDELREDEQVEEQEEEERSETASVRKRNVRRKTISTTIPDEKPEEKMEVAEETVEEEIVERKPRTRRQLNEQFQNTTIQPSEDEVSIASSTRRSTRRLSAEPSIFANTTPRKTTTVNADSDSVTSARRRRTIAIPQVPKEEPYQKVADEESVTRRRSTRSQQQQQVTSVQQTSVIEEPLEIKVEEEVVETKTVANPQVVTPEAKKDTFTATEVTSVQRLVFTPFSLSSHLLLQSFFL